MKTRLSLSSKTDDEMASAPIPLLAYTYSYIIGSTAQLYVHMSNPDIFTGNTLQARTKRPYCKTVRQNIRPPQREVHLSCKRPHNSNGRWVI